MLADGCNDWRGRALHSRRVAPPTVDEEQTQHSSAAESLANEVRVLRTATGAIHESNECVKARLPRIEDRLQSVGPKARPGNERLARATPKEAKTGAADLGTRRRCPAPPPPKRRRTCGVWVMYNQAEDLPWPTRVEGPFRASWAAKPTAQYMYGRILYNGRKSSSGWYRGTPFAVVEASSDSPHMAPREVTGYRYCYHGTDPKGIKSYSTFDSPLAAYCWVPALFLDFPPPEVGPRTLVDFVAAGASFVVEALHTLAMYIRENKLASCRRSGDALGQIAAALGQSDGEDHIIVMPSERLAVSEGVLEGRAKAFQQESQGLEIGMPFWVPE